MLGAWEGAGKPKMSLSSLELALAPFLRHSQEISSLECNYVALLGRKVVRVKLQPLQFLGNSTYMIYVSSFLPLLSC